MDVPLIRSFSVNYFVLADLQNLLYLRQFLGVDTKVLHSQVVRHQII